MNKLEVLYEDNHIIVVVKPCNVLSQADNTHDIDMVTIIKEYIKTQTKFSSTVTKSLLFLFAEKKMGISFKNADTIASLENIESPIMFINGENDMVVPPLLSKKLYENCDSDGVEEVIIEGGTHGKNLSADESTYWSYIDAFVLNYLGL